MDFTKKFGSLDPKVQAEWIDYDGSRFLIAPANNIAFKNKTLEMFKMGEIQSGGLDNLSAKRVIEIEAEVKAHTILLDWEKVEDHGAPVPYNTEKAKDMIVNYESFRQWLDTESIKLATKKQDLNDSKKKT
jgi:hypothetical protein